MKRKNIQEAAIAIFFIVAMVSMICCSRRKENPPNVVVVVIDTLRADHLPVYGYSKNTAPFISHMASQAVVFEKAYSASSWTAPATASIFTSLYPFQHGVVTGVLAARRLQHKNHKILVNRIPEEIQTLTELLRQRGYRTYGVSDNINIQSLQGFTVGFEKFRLFHNASAQALNGQIKKWADELRNSRPYYLYIHYNDPHEKYTPRSPWYHKRDDPLEDMKSAYDSEISYTDENFREIYELLGWNNNTLLILTADHGEEFGEHGGRGHGRTLYREVIHVPLIIYLPPGERVHRRVAAHVSTLDILPTIQDYLGLKRAKIWAGQSLLPMIGPDPAPKSPRIIYSHLQLKITGQPDQISISAISENWKFVRNLDGRNELFNLKRDFLEKQNWFGQPGYGEIAADLEMQFLTFEKKSPKFEKQTAPYALDQKLLEELKALGYIR